MAAVRRLTVSWCVLLFGIASLAQDLTLDRILAKNEEALGGAAAFRKVETLRVTTGAGTADSAGNRRILSMKRPHFARLETAIGNMSLVSGRQGGTRWNFNPMQQPMLQTNENPVAPGWFDSALASETRWLSGLQAAGASMKLLGMEEFQGAPAYKVQATPKGESGTVYYIDAATFLVVRTLTRIGAGDRFVDIEEIPGDYGEVGGIRFARSVPTIQKASDGGGSRVEYLVEFAVNEPMDDGIFAAPTAKMLEKMTRGMTLRGRLENIVVHGASLAGNLIGDSPDRPVTVYLPPSYDREPARRYPVVYLLHGFGGNNILYTQPALPTNIVLPAERAFAAGAREMILVVPSAANAFGGSMYSCSAATGDWESFIARDLVDYIDGHYRTVPDRTGRGLAGHSMGGYGAFRIGMKRPDVFSSLYSLSPCCMPPTMKPQPPLMERIDAMKSPQEVQKADFAVQAMAASAAAWSPNPRRPPFYFDLPVEKGAPRPDVIARWAANAPISMVHQYIPNMKRYRAIAFDIGDRDVVIAEGEDVMLQASRDMDRILSDYGVEHTFEIYPGDHTSGVLERMEKKVIPFFSGNLAFPENR